MKNKLLGVLVLTAFFAANTQADFTGQKKAACEAIMCLSTGSPPHECDDALKKYYKIVIKSTFGINPKKTLEARKNFLKLCPTDNAVDNEQLAKDSSTDIPTELAIITSSRVGATAYCKSVKKIAIDAKSLQKCIVTMTAEYARNNCKKLDPLEAAKCRDEINSNL
ncbi:TrbM/KikA/MpfK family conjugal transfer protein [Cellvibrio sp. OA-2007]|uniref:TrbM/KikA/MpfK family conjugal transfer protein n=1 Tax=Cellvibrio sp. OA-2007 TaxID=529823 RepID=UPI0007809062|nr:TrbM/KikA/MpfK family conjugal transfer protein [Cellvibrio sp. OA-2007]